MGTKHVTQMCGSTWVWWQLKLAVVHQGGAITSHQGWGHTQIIPGPTAKLLDVQIWQNHAAALRQAVGAATAKALHCQQSNLLAKQTYKLRECGCQTKGQDICLLFEALISAQAILSLASISFWWSMLVSKERPPFSADFHGRWEPGAAKRLNKEPLWSPATRSCRQAEATRQPMLHRNFLVLVPLKPEMLNGNGDVKMCLRSTWIGFKFHLKYQSFLGNRQLSDWKHVRKWSVTKKLQWM